MGARRPANCGRTEEPEVPNPDWLRLLTEAVTDYAYLLVSPTGRIIDWTPGASCIFGYEPEMIIGQELAVLFPAGEAHRTADLLREGTASGRADDNGWMVRSDGSRFWATGFTAALRDSHGLLIGYGKLVRDRTDEKRAEEALHDAELRFRLFMENVRDYAVLMLDPEGRVVDWNLGAEHLLGYGPDELRGQPFASLFTSEDVQRGVPEQELLIAADSGRATDDRRHVRRNGTYFWATGMTTAMRDTVGRLRGFCKVLRDSTERKHFEEELERHNRSLQTAHRLKDEFLAELAHELRNPLAPIVNTLVLMNESGMDEEGRREAMAMIDRQVRQLAHLVDDLLDASRISQGKVQLQRKPVNLEAVVQRAVQSARPIIDALQHKIVVLPASNAVYLDADPARIEQVLVNLLNNAAKYSEERGTITVQFKSCPRDSVGEIRIRDTGVGMAPDLIPHVFELFSQGKHALERTHGGLGIGLTLVKKLVELHGGTVEACSDGIGRGSEFVVRMPLADNDASSTPDEPLPMLPRRAENPRRVLLVDDNVDAAASLKRVLSAIGHQVSAAHCGLEALRLAEASPPEVILCDIGLPDLDGYQVAARVREMPELKEAVLVAVTGYGQDEDRRKARLAGFDHHLVKPVDPSALQQILDDSVGPR